MRVPLAIAAVSVVLTAATAAAGQNPLHVATPVARASNVRLAIVPLTGQAGPIVPAGLSRVALSVAFTVDGRGRAQPGDVSVDPLVARVADPETVDRLAGWMSLSRARLAMKDIQIEVLDPRDGQSVLSVPLNLAKIVSLAREGGESEAVFVSGGLVAPTSFHIGRRTPPAAAPGDWTLRLTDPKDPSHDASMPCTLVRSDLVTVLRVPVPGMREGAALADWIVATITKDGQGRNVRVDPPAGRPAGEAVALTEAFPIRVIFVDPLRIAPDGTLPPEIELTIAGWVGRL